MPPYDDMPHAIELLIQSAHRNSFMEHIVQSIVAIWLSWMLASIGYPMDVDIAIYSSLAVTKGVD